MNEFCRHIYLFIFHVLILKVVHMHFTPSFVVLKESKCICMLHIIINPLTPHGLKYMNILLNL
jgi:hypothetical protein